MRATSLFVAGFLTFLVACGDDESNPIGGSGGGSSAPGGGGATSEGGAGGSGGAAPAGGGGAGEGGGACVRQLGPADAERFVVVGHPNDEAGDPANTFGVLRLSPEGELTETDTIFEMGPPADQEIVFTPDGKLGFAVQDEGSIGVFRIDDDGVVTVLHQEFRAGFYADALAMSADGTTLYVVDGNFPKNGGGIYTVSIGCDDDMLVAGERLFETKNARAMVLFGENVALLAAREVPGSTVPSHAHRLTLPTTITASADVFGNDEAIVSWAALSRDDKYFLVGDNSSFSSEPNRVGIAEVTADGLVARQALEGIEDPAAIAMSPSNETAIVTSGFGDGIFVLDRTTSADAPYEIRGELPYVGAGPQLPGAIAMVQRGALDGHVLISDVRGVYRVQFDPGSDVVDLGVVDLSGEISGIVAGIGVQP